MINDPNAKRSWQDKLSDEYKLVVLNTETFQEISSYDISVRSIYILISSVIIGIGLLVACFIIFTPVRQWIPGYGEVSGQSEFAELTQTIDEITQQIDNQQTYLAGFRTMLTSGEFPESEELTPIQELRAAITTAEEQNSNLVAAAATKETPRSTPQTPESEKAGIVKDRYLIAPVSGMISANYMPEKKHLGVDILAPKNTPIKAILDGYVISSGWDLETGNTIGVQHNDNFVSFYKHNSTLLKEVGSFVKTGEAIAIIGNSGTLSDGPHLHFELWQNGKSVNPEDFIKF